MKVSAQYAVEHFSDLLGTAMRGEDVEIATPEQAFVRMTLIRSVPATARPKTRPLGRLKGLIELPSDEEWAAMDQEIEDLMVHAPLRSYP